MAIVKNKKSVKELTWAELFSLPQSLSGLLSIGLPKITCQKNSTCTSKTSLFSID